MSSHTKSEQNLGKVLWDKERKVNSVKRYSAADEDVSCGVGNFWGGNSGVSGTEISKST